MGTLPSRSWMGDTASLGDCQQGRDEGTLPVGQHRGVTARLGDTMR